MKIFVYIKYVVSSEILRVIGHQRFVQVPSADHRPHEELSVIREEAQPICSSPIATPISKLVDQRGWLYRPFISWTQEICKVK